MKRLVIFNEADNSIWGYITLGTDADSALYPPDPATQAAIEIPLDHPAPGDQANWHIVSRRLVSKATGLSYVPAPQAG